MTKILVIFLSLVSFALHAQKAENVVINNASNHKKANCIDTSVVIEPINVKSVNESFIYSKKEIIVTGTEKKNNGNVVVLEPVNATPVNESILNSKKEISVSGAEKKKIENVVVLEPVNAIPANEYKHGSVIKQIINK